MPHLSEDAAAAAADAEEGKKAARKRRTSGDAIQRVCNEARPRGTCFHSYTAPRVLRAPATGVYRIGAQKAPAGSAVCTVYLGRVELIRQQSKFAARRGTALSCWCCRFNFAYSSSDHDSGRRHHQESWNSTCSTCCGFAVQQAVQQIHSKTKRTNEFEITRKIRHGIWKSCKLVMPNL